MCTSSVDYCIYPGNSNYGDLLAHRLHFTRHAGRARWTPYCTAMSNLRSCASSPSAGSQRQPWVPLKVLSCCRRARALPRATCRRMSRFCLWRMLEKERWTHQVQVCWLVLMIFVARLALLKFSCHLPLTSSSLCYLLGLILISPVQHARLCRHGR